MNLRLRLLGLVALAAISVLVSSPSVHAQPAQATAPLITTAGDPVGNVTFLQVGTHVLVQVDVSNLPTGFHGFHVHSNAACDPATGFTSAGAATGSSVRNIRWTADTPGT